MFRGYGIACVVVLVAIAGLHFIYVRHVGAGPGAAHDPHRMLEETAHLAPCGVPMSVSRNLSSSKLDDLGDAGGNGVKGAGNGVKGAGNGVKGAGNGVKGAGNGVKGAGNGVKGAGNGVKGAGNGHAAHVDSDTSQAETPLT